ncbi:MAG: hypothetical protein ABSD74_03315 [Rhizomicrobium sp.]
MSKVRSKDRAARLARALRENLKRRKARDRAPVAVPSPNPKGFGESEAAGRDDRRPTPAATRD